MREFPKPEIMEFLKSIAPTSPVLYDMDSLEMGANYFNSKSHPWSASITSAHRHNIDPDDEVKLIAEINRIYGTEYIEIMAKVNDLSPRQIPFYIIVMARKDSHGVVEIKYGITEGYISDIERFHDDSIEKFQKRKITELLYGCGQEEINVFNAGDRESGIMYGNNKEMFGCPALLCFGCSSHGLDKVFELKEVWYVSRIGHEDQDVKASTGYTELCWIKAVYSHVTIGVGAYSHYDIVAMSLNKELCVWFAVKIDMSIIKAIESTENVVYFNSGQD